MTELSFLLELFLDKELPCSMRDKLVSRIREVEQNLIAKPAPNFIPTAGGGGVYQSSGYLQKQQQAPSTLAAMARHGEIPMTVPLEQPPLVQYEQPAPVAVIAQNPVTAAAMNHRNQTIADAIAGKTDKVTGRPKKW